jgi:maleylpyruvate isomerase
MLVALSKRLFATRHPVGAARLTLYDYPLSSASYRVRMALAIKGVDHDRITVDLREGAQNDASFKDKNPAGLVPLLVLADGRPISQSLAILRYLDSIATPRLFPLDPLEDARVSAMALSIACDIHPLNNLRVLKYLTGPLAISEAAKNDWYTHWIATGFAALEAEASAIGGSFCAGESLSAADLCLVPQMFNARRFNVDLSPYPGLRAIDARVRAIPAVEAVAPPQPA